jgi:hypothetical protein
LSKSVTIYYITIKYNNNSKQYLAFKGMTEGCRVYLYTRKCSRLNGASGNVDAEKQVRSIPLTERESSLSSTGNPGDLQLWYRKGWKGGEWEGG